MIGEVLAGAALIKSSVSAIKECNRHSPRCGRDCRIY